jgi:hypothetical protein
LLDESSWIQICSVEQHHAPDDDFKQYPIACFKVNIKNLKSTFEQTRRCVLFDETLVEKLRETFARSPTAEQGFQFWNKHPAEKRLQELVKQGGDAATRAPYEIQQDHRDFQDFPLHVFRQHLYQEKESCKEGAFWPKKGTRRLTRCIEMLKNNAVMNCRASSTN